MQRVARVATAFIFGLVFAAPSLAQPHTDGPAPPPAEARDGPTVSGSSQPPAPAPPPAPDEAQSSRPDQEDRAQTRDRAKDDGSEDPGLLGTLMLWLRSGGPLPFYRR